MLMKEIIDSAKEGKKLTKEETIKLLEIKNTSDDFYYLLSAANQMSREQYNNKGFVFTQIGLNAEPCSKNCRFCSLGADFYSVDSTFRKSMEDILAEVKKVLKEGGEDLFLMTTADYPFEDFIKVGKEVRKVIPAEMRLVANIGDFDFENAKKLKEAGFTGVYHIRRLREGIDTTIDPNVRLNTIKSLTDAGLEFYYCVEPIGPEHTYDEIADEMIRARDYNVSVMAVMRRSPVMGTPFADKGQISTIEFTKIAAVARLVSQPSRAMNAHEVTPFTLLAGVNQLYAEIGVNPRDNNSQTECNRGCSIEEISQLLMDVDFVI